jgi:hypothetical protein
LVARRINEIKTAVYLFVKYRVNATNIEQANCEIGHPLEKLHWVVAGPRSEYCLRCPRLSNETAAREPTTNTVKETKTNAGVSIAPPLKMAAGEDPSSAHCAPTFGPLT